jgi:hypothetical protein
MPLVLPWPVMNRIISWASPCRSGPMNRIISWAPPLPPVNRIFSWASPCRSMGVPPPASRESHIFMGVPLPFQDSPLSENLAI